MRMEASARDWALGGATRLDSVKIVDSGGYTWNPSEGNTRQADVGYAFGISGVGDMLMMMSVELAEPHLLELAKGTADWLVAKREIVDENSSRWRRHYTITGK